jgi:casein kinase II subunit alpha
MQEEGSRSGKQHCSVQYSISRVYAFINQYLVPDKDKAIDDFELKYGTPEAYRIIRPIGSGKNSLVFLGRRFDDSYCAIKVLKSVAFTRIKRELFILKKIASVKNVIHVLDVNRDPLTSTISFVTTYASSEPFWEIYPQFTLDDIRYYMYLLLSTLDECHAKGIMHRDIKPGNVCIHPRDQSLCIIDWGLSDLYYPLTQYSVRVSTLRYKSPELLLGYHFYDYGIDIWGAGCIFAEMLFEVDFIKGKTVPEVMESWVKLIGNSDFLNYCETYGITYPKGFDVILSKRRGDGWDLAIALMRPTMRDPDAIDLLKKMFIVDHRERITAREAILHPFFQYLF